MTKKESKVEATCATCANRKSSTLCKLEVKKDKHGRAIQGQRAFGSQNPRECGRYEESEKSKAEKEKAKEKAKEKD